MRRLARMTLHATYPGMPEAGEHGSLLLREFVAAVDRLDPVRSVGRSQAAGGRRRLEQEVVAEFEHVGDEEAAAEYAFLAIHHPALDAAIGAVGGHRPSSCGAQVQVDALSDQRTEES